MESAACPLSDRIARCAASLRNAAGWRRAGLAFAFGSVAALTMPPFNLFPLLWVCLPALVFLLQGTRNDRQAFVTGWMFATGFLVFSLYWIAASMFVDLAHFWWAIPLSVFALPAGFAIYNGIVAVAARRLGLNGVSGAIVFGLMWFLGDVARGNMFSGFPWNLIGYSWSGVLPVLQTTSVVGIYGLTLFTCIAAALPAALADKTKTSGIANMLGVAFFIALGAWGEIRLHTTQITQTPDVYLRLVQPDVDQAHKWLQSERARDFEQLLDLNSMPSSKPVTHYIWPETASTYYLSEDAPHRQEIADRIPAAAAVVTGVIRREFMPDNTTRYYNSLVALDGLGRLVAGYDKVHLVPFGEYMPMRKILPIRALAADIADFTPGDGVRSLRVLGLPPFSPLICYEAIFSGDVVDRKDRPDFIVNVTNDAWYGNTIGPYQHFANVRVRAIEEGLPLVRAANTGISGVVDPVGRVTARLGLGKRGVIDSDLAMPLPPTFFARWGQIPAAALFLTISAAVLAVQSRKKAAIP